MLKNPISYQGSKQGELKVIESKQPDYFDKIVDVFGGGGSVSLFYLQSYEVKVIYNDISPDMCELFRVLKNTDETKALIEKLDNIPISDEEYLIRRDSLKEAFKNNTEDLVNFIYCSTYACRGRIFSSGVNRRDGVICKRKNFNTLLEYSDILQPLNITNEDALKVIKNYQSDEDAFLYLDPPYLQKGSDNTGYRSASVDLLKSIFDLIKDPKTKCKILLHMDFSGWIYAEMKDFIKHYYPAKYKMTGAKGKHNGTNYHQRYHVMLCNY
jgi:site-specific DNA-adenine methylase